MNCCKGSIVRTGLLRFDCENRVVEVRGSEVWFKVQRSGKVAERYEVAEVVEGSGILGGLGLKIGEEVRG
ncbi:hypothetical protein AMTR_s00057p00044820 [Amborella trichopoda]|uniref:Uncharacterized protein n=1 Tax=Amborella trichopoda TaxID=13333 RepID=U5D2V0_AMBTC|nr:hypothetical protein AMTR_s00057p00044820 [Amborella trichopoda]